MEHIPLGLQIKVFLNMVLVFLAGMVTFTLGHLSHLLNYIDLSPLAISMFSVLILIDYFTGIRKSKVLGENISSHKMKYGILSKVYLLIVPLSFAFAGKASPFDLSFVISTSLFLLVLSEMYSILGNVYTVRTGEELPEWEVLSIMAKNIRKLEMNFFSKEEGKK